MTIWRFGEDFGFIPKVRVAIYNFALHFTL